MPISRGSLNAKTGLNEEIPPKDRRGKNFDFYAEMLSGFTPLFLSQRVPVINRLIVFKTTDGILSPQ
jgi:hypothetical protein